MLTGSRSKTETVRLCKEIKEILEQYEFVLRKWVSNSTEVLKQIDQNSQDDLHSISEHENAKTLGLTWACTSDEFIYKTNLVSILNTVTKRSIPSTTSHIFVPLGLLSPITIKAKILLQKLWLEKVSWDEALSHELHTAWLKLYNMFQTVTEIKIPRQVIHPNYLKLQIHGFTDASEKAYGACMYIRSLSDNMITVRLLCAKTRVAPLKPLTIPKLELCAALLLSKLVNKVVSKLELSFESCTLWSDSNIVLAWIKTSPNLLKTFVRNRIGDIQSLTKCYTWKHISTHQNPADLLTSGLEPKLLTQCHLWWYDPSWLSKPESQWQDNDTIHINQETLPE